MQSLAVNGYTQQQVDDVLHSKYRPRTVAFKYNLLDKNEIYKATLSTVVSGEIDMDFTADIKRTAKLHIEDDGSINWLSDRIQPFFMLLMPDGGWATWSLGIFLLSSPTGQDVNGKIYRDVECYDGLQILNDNKVITRYTITAGTTYFSAITTLFSSAGITKMNIQQTTQTLPADKEYDPSTSYLKIINDLLSDMTYTALWVDEYGYFTSWLYQTPAVRGVGYTYQNDNLSITYNGVQNTLDLFAVPNSWTVVASNAETPPLTSTYTNSNPNSLTSTVSRGRTIVNYSTIDTIADQPSLDAYVQKTAFEDSQVYGQLVFDTAIMPMHSYDDILQVNYSYQNISDKYEEIGWTLPLVAGGKMQHNTQKVVQI